MDLCFSIVICCRLLGSVFTLDVHETLLALTLYDIRLIVKIYDITVLCIVEFIGHLLSDRDSTSSTGVAAGGNWNNHWGMGREWK